MSLSTSLTVHQYVLLSLSLKPAKSIAALARELEMLRPSISRAVRFLLEKQLVSKQGRALYLTKLGEEEVQSIKGTLPTQAEKTTNLATHALEQANESWKQAERFAGSKALAFLQPKMPHLEAAIINSVKMLPSFAIDTQLVEALNNIADLRKSLDTSVWRQAVEAFAGIDTIQMAVSDANHLATQMQEAMTATAHIQSINLDWFQGLQVPSNSFAHLLVENNTFMSSMIRDLAAMSQISSNLTSSSENLVYQTTDVTKAYNAYYAELTPQFNSFLTLVKNEGIRVAVPTTTTSILVGTVRSIVESQTTLHEKDTPTYGEPTTTNSHIGHYQAMSPLLDQYLTPLGERFVRKWHGAWQTLSSASEDRYSQALHSGRELLMQVLAELAPESVFTSEDLAKYDAKKPTRRMQAKYILDNSKTGSEWVEKMAAAIDSMYAILAAESHSRDENVLGDDSAASLLIVLGGLMMFLSAYQDTSSS